MVGNQNEEPHQAEVLDNERQPPASAVPGPMVLRYFLVLFLLSGLAMARVLWPFCSILILSFLLTSVFKPIYRLLQKYFSPSFSSLVTCCLIVMLVFVPLLFFVGALSKEALGLYQLIKTVNIDLGVKLKHLMQEISFLARMQEQLSFIGVNIEPQRYSDALTGFTKMVGLFLYNQASAWAGNIMNFVFSFFMMVLVIFFLLIDQDRLVSFILRLSPLPGEQERRLFRKFDEIAGAILIGNGICGLIQGVLGGAVLAFLGLGSPILWGGVMVILAFLPIFGIGLVLMPAAIILFLKGDTGAALFMVLFYAGLSFSVEYLLKPKMVGDRVKMHTLLVFLAILGGLASFGVLGIIYGPLIATAFLTLSEIYLEVYQRHIKEYVDKS